MSRKNQRLHDLQRFYKTLGKLECYLGGRRRLGACDGRGAVCNGKSKIEIDWPQQGVYFFFEHSEVRKKSGDSRVVRVGTHAVDSRGARSTLWSRLRQHRGSKEWHGGGSIFRDHIGRGLLARDGNPPSETYREHGGGRIPDHEMERRISAVTREMSFLWLKVLGPPDKRAYVERNAIALLSNYNKPAMDAPSAFWLGKHADEKIHLSGLWNVKHVDDAYESEFLDRLEKLVEKMKPGSSKKRQISV